MAIPLLLWEKSCRCADEAYTAAHARANEPELSEVASKRGPPCVDKVNLINAECADPVLECRRLDQRLEALRDEQLRGQDNHRIAGLSRLPQIPASPTSIPQCL